MTRCMRAYVRVSSISPWSLGGNGFTVTSPYGRRSTKRLLSYPNVNKPRLLMACQAIHTMPIDEIKSQAPFSLP